MFGAKDRFGKVADFEMEAGAFGVGFPVLGVAAEGFLDLGVGFGEAVEGEEQACEGERGFAAGVVANGFGIERERGFDVGEAFVGEGEGEQVGAVGGTELAVGVQGGEGEFRSPPNLKEWVPFTQVVEATAVGLSCR